jgi:hypothetical protein
LLQKYDVLQSECVEFLEGFVMDKTKIKCKLCGMHYSEDEMSEEHYPARSVGNEDIIALDIVKMIDSFQSEEMRNDVLKKISAGESADNILGDILDTKLSKSIYPAGRTARTLCRKCNTFLGKYDAAYLKFFSLDGGPKRIKGFKESTKLQIIKSIFGKFLSVQEAKNEEFDFLDFLNNEVETKYSGKWKLYFIKRDFSTDLLGLNDIGTGKATFDEGIVYELSDDRFIFNLMNFEKHSCFSMTNIFDILNRNYVLVKGTGNDGGYHAQILMSRLFQNADGNVYG